MNRPATRTVDEQTLGMLLSFAAPPEDADPGIDDVEVRELLAPSGVFGAGELPGRVDLRESCSPVRWQGAHHTCSSHAMVALLELMTKRAFGREVRLSPLFLHYEARRVAGKLGGAGVYVSEVINGLLASGVAREAEWPYVDPEGVPGGWIDQEPTPAAYESVERHDDLRCFRLDRGDRRPGERTELLNRIRAFAAASIPCTIDFPLDERTFEHSAGDGRIGLPGSEERVLAQHTVLVTGYDDRLEVASPTNPGQPTRGAFLIKNSWSERWGEGGYGWLPYRWLLDGHVRSCWSMMRRAWMATGRFSLPARSCCRHAAAPRREERAVA